MTKEEVYLDLTKLSKEQLINIAKITKKELYQGAYNDFIKGVKGFRDCLVYDKEDGLYRSNETRMHKITYDQFINLFQEKEEIKQPTKNFFSFNINFEIGYNNEDDVKVDDENWYKIITNKQVSYKKKTKQFIDKLSDYPNVKTELITDYHFINLLEKNSK